MKNILIIGATSSIAVACARTWSEERARIFLVGRNGRKLSQISEDLVARGGNTGVFEMDLNNYSQHNSMVDAAYTFLGKIDVLLIAHGTLPDQVECEKDPELAMKEFHSNGMSVIGLLTILGNKMEAQREGVIAVISSVAGDRGRPTNYLYGSAKAAVSAFCGGLRARMFKSGVHVLTIKPGFVDTPMTAHLSLPKPLTSSSDQVARSIHSAIKKKRNTIYTGWYWRYIMTIIVLLPEFIFKRKHI